MELRVLIVSRFSKAPWQGRNVLGCLHGLALSRRSGQDIWGDGIKLTTAA